MVETKLAVKAELLKLEANEAARRVKREGGVDPDGSSRTASPAGTDSDATMVDGDGSHTPEVVV